ncbi:hypothetical protein F5Y10DRAFT_267857 [Nemania abortiva]|nr:hypothetical protein F5Y10DRAFT_267857 [Nemania abortiva]
MYNLRPNKRRLLDSQAQTCNPTAAKKRKIRQQAVSPSPTRCNARRSTARAAPSSSLEQRVLSWLEEIPEYSKSRKQQGGHDEIACEARASNMPRLSSQSMPPPPTPPLTLSQKKRKTYNTRAGKSIATRANLGIRVLSRGRRAREQNQSTDAGSSAQSSTGTDGFTTISSPPPSGYTSRASSGDGRTKDPFYYQLILCSSNIEILGLNSEYRPPAAVSAQLESLKKPSSLPGLSPKFIKGFRAILGGLQMGDDEAALTELMMNILPSYSPIEQDNRGDPSTYLNNTTGLIYTLQALMLRHLVPPLVVIPKPDRIYGYSYRPWDTVFNDTQRAMLLRLQDDSGNYLAIANDKGLCFPFFIIELKGQGKIWAAANQIAGGCFASLRSVQSINMALEAVRSENPPSSPSRTRGRGRTRRGTRSRPTTHPLAVDNFVYGLSANSTIAHLYIAWHCKNSNGGDGCKILEIENFMLRRENELNLLWARIRNILDWGKGTRLQQVRKALDGLEAGGFGK